MSGDVKSDGVTWAMGVLYHPYYIHALTLELLFLLVFLFSFLSPADLPTLALVGALEALSVLLHHMVGTNIKKSC